MDRMDMLSNRTIRGSDGSRSHHGIKKVPCFNAIEQGTAVNPFQGWITECISNKHTFYL